MKINQQLGTLRQQCRRQQEKRRRSKVITFTVTLPETARGHLVFSLPPGSCINKHWRVGGRVWFVVDIHALLITTKPWGPYPSLGRRISNRLPRNGLAGSRSEPAKEQNLH